MHHVPMNEEPRSRLRRVRLAARLSPEDLAALIGRAPSTVRAHENGQNAIRADAAKRYGSVLGFAPGWLLYGEGIGPASPDQLNTQVRQLPVLADVRLGTWVEIEQQQTAHMFIPFSLIGFDDVELTAYRLAEDFQLYRTGTIIICVSWDNFPIDLGDDIILRRTRGDLAEHSLWHVSEADAESLEYKGRQPVKKSRIPFDKAIETGFGSNYEMASSGEIVGVVVGYFWLTSRRPFRVGHEK